MLPPKLRAPTALILCGLLAATLSSCGYYSRVRKGADSTHYGLDEGDQIRIHLVDGRVVEDSLVELTQAELICETQTIRLDSVERIEKRNSAVNSLILMGAVMAAMFLVTMNQAMSSSSWL
jgi:hypothetical protein